MPPPPIVGIVGIIDIMFEFGDVPVIEPSPELYVGDMPENVVGDEPYGPLWA
jgi:hypothetical protein